MSHKIPTEILSCLREHNTSDCWRCNSQSYVRHKQPAIHCLISGISDYDPAYGLIEATFASYREESFFDDSLELEEILQCPYEDIDVRMLGAA